MISTICQLISRKNYHLYIFFGRLYNVSPSGWTFFPREFGEIGGNCINIDSDFVEKFCVYDQALMTFECLQLFKSSGWKFSKNIHTTSLELYMKCFRAFCKNRIDTCDCEWWKGQKIILTSQMLRDMKYDGTFIWRLVFNKISFYKNSWNWRFMIKLISRKFRKMQFVQKIVYIQK